MSTLRPTGQCNNAPTSRQESIFTYVLTLAVILAYFPQYQRIILRNSSHGISPLFILLGTAFTTSALASTLLLPIANGGYECCDLTNLHCSQCFRALAGIAQAGLQWLASAILLTIYLLFHPRPAPPPTTPALYLDQHAHSTSFLALSPHSRRASSSAPYPPSALLLVTTVLLTIVLLGPTLTAFLPPSLLFLVPHSFAHTTWPSLVAALSILAATLLPLPQLLTTLKLKTPAGLSVATLAAQAPISIALGVLGLMRGRQQHSPEETLTWSAFVVSGAGQALLLGVCLWVGRWGDGGVLRQGQEEDRVGTVGEETPLLPGERRGMEEERVTMESKGAGAWRGTWYVWYD